MEIMISGLFFLNVVSSCVCSVKFFHLLTQKTDLDFEFSCYYEMVS